MTDCCRVLDQSWQHMLCSVYTRLGSGRYQCNWMRSSLLVKSHYRPSIASTRNTILTWHYLWMTQIDWFYICRLFLQCITAFIHLNHEWQLPRTMFSKSTLYNRVKIIPTRADLNSALLRRLRAIILAWTPWIRIGRQQAKLFVSLFFSNFLNDHQLITHIHSDYNIMDGQNLMVKNSGYDIIMGKLHVMQETQSSSEEKYCQAIKFLALIWNRISHTSLKYLQIYINKKLQVFQWATKFPLFVTFFPFSDFYKHCFNVI